MATSIAPPARLGIGPRSSVLLRLAVGIGPDADVVGLQAQAHAPLELERLDVGARQLKPPGAVEDGELLGDDLVVAVIGDRGAPKGLGRGPSVADGDGPLDLLATPAGRG